MRIETKDNNEKSKEFLWKRSNNLAHLVSQRLTNAAQSIMKPVIASTPPNQTEIQWMMENETAKSKGIDKELIILENFHRQQSIKIKTNLRVLK